MATGRLPKGDSLVRGGTPVTRAVTTTTTTRTTTTAATTATTTTTSPGSMMATRRKQAKTAEEPYFPLENLPAVVLDKVLDNLSPQDLRSVHQVSKAWQKSLVSRPRIDSRRVDLVTRIRLNKENIARGTSSALDFGSPRTKETPELRARTCSSNYNNSSSSNNNHNNDGKPGGRSVLSSVESYWINSAPTAAAAGIAAGRNGDGGRLRGTTDLPPPPVSSGNLTTPTSRFLREYEAGKKLLKGQELFRCPECRSPVPSPVVVLTPKRTRARRIRPVTRSTPKGPPHTSTASSTQSSSLSLTSPSLTQDSGFDSIHLSSTPALSSSALSTDGDHNSEEASSSAAIFDLERTNRRSRSSQSCRIPGNITLSFIATPDGREGLETSITPQPDPAHHEQHDDRNNNNSSCSSWGGDDDDDADEDDGFDDDDSSLGMIGNLSRIEPSPAPAPLPLPPPSVKCPQCSHRFCCKCQCTEHPGRPCREIDGDVTVSPPPPLEEDPTRARGPTTSSHADTDRDLRRSKKRSKEILRRLARV